MNDYLNHKWRKWANEDRSPRRPRRKLNENQEAPAKVTQSKKVLHYPQFQLNDDFGKKGTPLRDEVEKFFRQVSRERSLPAKLAAIQKFLNPSEAYVKSMSIKKCLGTLTMLDTFSTLVHKFDPSSAGYLMEPFMAAVYGGKGKQVKTGEGGIEDIWDFNGKFISLKLLAGGPIEGSLRDLRRTIYDLNNNQPITYIVVEKIGEAENISQLKFYEFTIGTDGREWQWVTERGKRLYKKGVDESIDFLPSKRGVPGTFVADAHTGRANASPFQKTGQLDPDTTYAPPASAHTNEVRYLMVVVQHQNLKSRGQLLPTTPI